MSCYQSAELELAQDDFTPVPRPAPAGRESYCRARLVKEGTNDAAGRRQLQHTLNGSGDRDAVDPRYAIRGSARQSARSHTFLLEKSRMESGAVRIMPPAGAGTAPSSWSFYGGVRQVIGIAGCPVLGQF